MAIAASPPMPDSHQRERDGVLETAPPVHRADTGAVKDGVEWAGNTARAKLP